MSRFAHWLDGEKALNSVPNAVVEHDHVGPAERTPLRPARLAADAAGENEAIEEAFKQYGRKLMAVRRT